MKKQEKTEQQEKAEQPTQEEDEEMPAKTVIPDLVKAVMLETKDRWQKKFRKRWTKKKPTNVEDKKAI